MIKFSSKFKFRSFNIILISDLNDFYTIISLKVDIFPFISSLFKVKCIFFALIK